MDAAQALLGAHRQFSQWRRQRARVLATVEHVFPPKHPLRLAVCRALYGDPLAECTLQADNAACRLCDIIGEDEFEGLCGLPCTQLFYGTRARADAAGLPAQPVHSQWIRLEDCIALSEIGRSADGLVRSTRELTSLPRARSRIDGCAARFLTSWEVVLASLQHVAVDLSDAFAVEISLRRLGLPADICRHILELAVPWPILVGDGPVPLKKRRRVR